MAVPFPPDGMVSAMPFDGPETLAGGAPLDTSLPHIARVYDYWPGGTAVAPGTGVSPRPLPGWVGVARKA